MSELKNLTLGIEEEYQIIDPASRELTSFISEFLETGAMMFKDQVKPELLQSQIEIGSNVGNFLKVLRARNPTNFGGNTTPGNQATSGMKLYVYMDSVIQADPATKTQFTKGDL